MKKWLLQSTTLAGLLSLPITAIQAYQTGGDWMTVALGVINALLLLVNDGKFLKGLSAAVIAVAFGATACGSIDLPETMTAEQVETGICAGMKMDGCLNASMDAIGIRQATCHEDIQALIAGDISLDAQKLSEAKRVCQKYVVAVLSYIEKVRDKVE